MYFHVTKFQHYPESTILFLKLLAGAVKLLITISEMGQEKKLVAFGYNKCYSFFTGDLEAPRYHAVVRLVRASDYQGLSGFRDSLEGITNLIWAVVIRHEPTIKKSMNDFSLSQSAATIEVGNNLSIYANWCELASFCFLVFPNDAFANPVTLEVLTDMFKNGPLLDMGNGESVQFAQTLEAVSKGYKLSSKFRPLEMCEAPFQDAIGHHKTKRDNLIAKLWGMYNLYKEDSPEVHSFIVYGV
jgi:hypothetical protein